MRHAKKEGRYMGTASLGYVNKMTEAGKKYIASRVDEAIHYVVYAYRQENRGKKMGQIQIF